MSTLFGILSAFILLHIFSSFLYSSNISITSLTSLPDHLAIRIILDSINTFGFELPSFEYVMKEDRFPKKLMLRIEKKKVIFTVLDFLGRKLVESLKMLCLSTKTSYLSWKLPHTENLVIN